MTTGVALGIGGPKRLGITLLTAATISTAALGESRTISLAILYVAIATVLVWVPTIIYIVLGPRAGQWFSTAEAWLRGHRQVVEAYTLLGLGASLLVDAVVHLATS